jgi:hypothetical protein
MFSITIVLVVKAGEAPAKTTNYFIMHGPFVKLAIRYDLCPFLVPENNL